MEFRFTDEQVEVQRRVRDCCRRQIAPGAADLDAASAEESQKMIIGRARILAREGLLGLGLPSELGGVGGDLLGTVVLHQELGEACPATALSVLSSVGLCARALCEWGEKGEQNAFLGGLLGGETVGACGDLEPEASLDAWTPKSKASASGSGAKLTGEKAMVLNAPMAGPKILTASADDSAALFLVSPDASGLEISPAHTKLGCRGVPTADISLKGCTAVRLAPDDGPGSVATAWRSPIDSGERWGAPGDPSFWLC